MKLGQWAATRPDLFPSDLCSALGRLHDNVRIENPAYTIETIEGALGGEGALDHLLQDRRTLQVVGSGCISTVYRGTLMDGRKVVFKVRRRGVVDIVKMDLFILNLLASFIDSFKMFEFLGAKAAADNFSRFMTAQLDLTVEGRNLRQFNANFSGYKGIVFPKCLLAQTNLLVESFEEGVSMSRVMQSSNVKAKKQVAEIGLNAYLHMVIVHNFTHSDLHPGNIFVRLKSNGDSNSSSGEAVDIDTVLAGGPSDDAGSNGEKNDYNFELVFIDTGLVTRLHRQDWINFLDLFQAVAVGDGQLAAKLMLERSKSSVVCKTPERFQHAMTAIVKQAHSQNFQLDKLNIGKVLNDVLDAARVNNVPIESSYVSLILGIITIEGIGRQLDSDLNIFKNFILFLNDAIKRKIVPMLVQVHSK